MTPARISIFVKTQCYDPASGFRYILGTIFQKWKKTREKRRFWGSKSFEQCTIKSARSLKCTDKWAFSRRLELRNFCEQMGIKDCNNK